MDKKHIITLCGDLGSGKGAVSTALAETLGYEIYRNGEYARMLARNLGMNITEFNIYVEKHPEIDNQIEESAAGYAKEHDNLIIDARLGWYAVPYSFKVYLKVDPDVAAKRAFYDEKRKSSEKFDTIEKQKQDMLKRVKLENDRFFKIYGIHKDDMSNYDFVIDTTNLTVEEVKNEILEKYNIWLKENKIN